MTLILNRIGSFFLSFFLHCARWAWMLLFLVTLSVYLLTLSPGALGGDPGELQFVPAILGMPHPTGTPLYVLLGKVWSWLPLGPSVAWRMNLLAAVAAALAVVLVYQCVYLAWGRPVPALAAALSLAFGLTFWEQAVLADKYAFNALMVALVIYLALRWGQTRSPRVLDGLALAYGLSLAHHRTMALFAPALLGYVWWHERSSLWKDKRRLLRLLALCLLPLSLYLYLPWAEMRNLPPGTWRPRTLRQWYDYLFDTGRTGLVYIDPRDLGQMLVFYARTLWRDFTPVGVLLGVGGLVVQFRRRSADAVLLAFNFISQAFLAANHHVPRHWVYFIPSFVVFSLWTGEALAALLGWAVGWRDRKGGKGRFFRLSGLPVFLLAVLAFLWPLAPFRERYLPLRDAHLGYGVLDPWRQTLKTGHMADRIGAAIAGVQPDAIILCDWEQATPLWYYQQVEGLRPDVQIVYPIERLDEMAALGRPLYIARTLPGVAERWYPSHSQSLIALRDRPSFEVPAGSMPLALDFGGVIELAGFDTGPVSHQPSPDRLPFRPPQVVPLILYWRTIAVPAHDYSVSLRLFDGAGGQVFQVDSQHPVLGMYPTSKWEPGEVVADYYEVQLPPALQPGLYRWGVILYRALPEGGWESLKVKGIDAEIGMAGTFEVARR